jgi:hypothetical protein
MNFRAMAALGGALILGGGAFLLLGQGATLDEVPATPIRLAVADQACPEEGQPGFAYLHNHCVWHKTRGQWCLCLTHDTDKLTGEVDRADLPNAAFRRAALCQVPAQGQVPAHLEFVLAKLTDTAPPGWTCRVMCPKILWAQSQANVKLDLEECLETACAPCQITGNSWGRCPECWWDSSCATACPAPPDGGTP